MTYADLLENLKTLTQEQLNMTVTVFVSEVDEFYAPHPTHPWVVSTEDEDRLDPGHPYLEFTF